MQSPLTAGPRRAASRIGLVIAAFVLMLTMGAEAAHASASDWTIRDFAGVPGQTGTSLSGPAFGVINAIATDSAGDVYVADPQLSVVWKVTPNGHMSVFAGDGTSAPPTYGAQADQTSLDFPVSVAVDPAGDVFIGDNSDQVIERVSPSGVLTHFAGNGAYGVAANGTALGEPIDDPVQMATDSAGDLYVATYSNREVDEISPGGQLTVRAGTGNNGTPTNGPATSEDLGKPGGLVVDRSGNFYLSDYANHEILEVTPAGQLSVLAGTGSAGTPSAGPAISEPLNGPQGLALAPDGTLYVASRIDNTIDAITPNGQISPLAPAGPGAAPTYGVPFGQTTLDFPIGLVMSPAGVLYVDDEHNDTVDSLTPTAPTNLTAPSVTGTAAVGQSLSASLGQWSGDEITYAEQWQRCATGGSGCVAIGGATGDSYTPDSADVGSTLRVRVTATNAGGVAGATSAATAAATAAATTTTVAPVASSSPTASAPTSPAPTPGSGAAASGSPTATPGAGAADAVTVLGSALDAGLELSPSGEVALPLACPVTPAGCDADGLLTLADAPGGSAGAGAHLVQTTVLARFAGVAIASGRSRLIGVRLSASAIRSLQARRVRRVLVTLTIDNHLNGGPSVRSVARLTLRIPAPKAICLAPTGRLSASGVGALRLGLGRRAAERLGRHRRVGAGFERFCLLGGGSVRVVYRSSGLVKRLTHRPSRSSRGIVLALTPARRFALRGVHNGSSVSAARRRLALGRGTRIGRNTWYTVVRGRVSWIVKAQHGVVRELGVAATAPARSASAQRGR